MSARSSRKEHSAARRLHAAAPGAGVQGALPARAEPAPPAAGAAPRRAAPRCSVAAQAQCQCPASSRRQALTSAWTLG